MRGSIPLTMTNGQPTGEAQHAGFHRPNRRGGGGNFAGDDGYPLPAPDVPFGVGGMTGRNTGLQGQAARERMSAMGKLPAGLATQQTADPAALMPASMKPANRLGWSTPFAKSVMRTRARRAAGAATYAAGLPKPTDPRAAADRAAYIRRQQMAADDDMSDATGDPSFAHNQRLAVDENARANAESGASTGYTNATTQHLVPANAAFTGARTRSLDAETQTEDAMRDPRVGMGNAEVDRFQQLTPSMVKGAEQGVQDASEQIGALRGVVRDFTGATNALRGGRGNTPPAPKAMSGRDLIAYYDLLKQERGDGQADAWLDAQLGNGQQQPEAASTQPTQPIAPTALPAGSLNPGLPLSLQNTQPSATQRGAGVPLTPAFGGANQPAAQPTGIVRVNSPAEARRLPRGTRFMSPDGQVRTVP